MKRGYIGTIPTNDSDNQAAGTTGVEPSKGSSQTDISTGGCPAQATNLPTSSSTDNSQYLLLHHPSTTSEGGSHKSKKTARLARQKMLAISGFTSGFAKSFDLSSNWPMPGQTISGVTTGNSAIRNSTNVISDSHAQRKAMFLKQRRVSIGYDQPIDDSSGYARYLPLSY